MFEMDDDFDLDEVLDTVSMIEQEALRAIDSSKPDNSDNKKCDTRRSFERDESLDAPMKCPVKRKSDTEADINTKVPKRSSQDCLRLLESGVRLSPQKQQSLTLPNNSVESKKPIETISTKPSTTWKMGNAGNTSGNTSVCGMRTIPATCQRKFPGPAGLLPERAHRVSYALNESDGHNTSSQSDIPLCSQPTQTLDVGPWQALRCDLQEARDLLDKYTLSWVKQKVATRRLAGQKIPFLSAVLHNVDTSSPDPIIVLRDKTGFINGSIHRSVWECHGGQLVQGSALVLRLIGVACTGSPTQQRLYVNVTANNIVTIYSPSPDGDVNVTEVHPLDIEEIRQRVREWEAKCKADAALAANSSVQNSSLFSNVLDRTPLRQIAPPSPRPSASVSRPVSNTNLQRTVNNVRNQSDQTPNPGNTSENVPKASNLLNRVELPNTSNQVDQNKVVTSTQTSEAEKMSVDVSSFLEGFDTDLLFDEF